MTPLRSGRNTSARRAKREFAWTDANKDGEVSSSPPSPGAASRAGRALRLQLRVSYWGVQDWTGSRDPPWTAGL